jgi:malonate decarboxylase beta subunit
MQRRYRMIGRQISYFEASARKRLVGLVDENSLREFCPPEQRRTSPHLALLDAPVAFDDGVVVGSATLAGHAVLFVAQEGRFNGGAVGEVHGAKICGLLARALNERPAAVLLLADSGGVRLHEANAGLIAISEIMRAVLDVQAAGIPVFALVGGSCGAFGGMGIVVRLCDQVIMSEQGRLGLSGPEVIETVKGVEEFDARDRALVWRVTGGKLRRTLGEATMLVDDLIPAFREAAIVLTEYYLARPFEPAHPGALFAAQARLADRSRRYCDARDGRDIWQANFSDAARVPDMTVAEFNARQAEGT